MILMATTRVFFSLQQVTLYYHGKGFLQGRGRGKKAAPGGAQEVGGGQVKGAFLQASDAAVVGTLDDWTVAATFPDHARFCLFDCARANAVSLFPPPVCRC